MDVINSIFEAVGRAITSFTTNLSSAVSGITSMFYTQGDGSGSLTFLGVLLCIAMGIGLVYWAFRLIRGLIKHKG